MRCILYHVWLYSLKKVVNQWVSYVETYDAARKVLVLVLKKVLFTSLLFPLFMRHSVDVLEMYNYNVNDRRSTR